MTNTNITKIELEKNKSINSMEEHKKLHEEVLDCLPNELIDLVMKFNPYIEPFEKFKQDTLEILIDEMKNFDNDMEEDDFIELMDDHFNYHFNTDYMEIVKEDDLDKILENKLDRFLEMVEYIQEINDDYFGSDMKIEYNKERIVNIYRYCYAYVNKPTYEDYLKYHKNL